MFFYLPIRRFRYGVAEARARQLAEARNLRLEAPYEVSKDAIDTKGKRVKVYTRYTILLLLVRYFLQIPF
jgi:hypothetical protein